jgi:dienelactone hydrolase
MFGYMKLVVISDIFGRTPELIELIAELADLYCETAIVDPYNGSFRHFETEAQAYQQFQTESGLKNLLEVAAKEIRRSNTQVDILGFSIGGTCAWNLSSQGDVKQIRQCICFYGSRIRDNIDAIPQVPTTAIFPRYEVAFDIDPVIKELSTKDNTEIMKTPYRHGFMNRKSSNFSIEAYKYFIPWLRNKTLQLSI